MLTFVVLVTALTLGVTSKGLIEPKDDFPLPAEYPDLAVLTNFSLIDDFALFFILSFTLDLTAPLTALFAPCFKNIFPTDANAGNAIILRCYRLLLRPTKKDS